MIEFVELIKVIILGIVEGITEFLPISSTGHLIVASALLDFRTSLEGTFEIFIQLGAVVAVVALYRADLLNQIKTVRTNQAVQRLWLALIIATIPAAAVGFLARDFIKETLFSPLVVAITLIVGGIVLILVEKRNSHVENTALTFDLYHINLRQALLIGLAQTLAYIPGMSRSAASIIGGMVFGLSREVATRFSFYLAIPTLGGATIVDLLLNLEQVSTNDLVYLLVGTIVSGLVAWFAVGWLLRYIASNNFIPFGYYRIAAGLVFLALMALNVL